MTNEIAHRGSSLVITPDQEFWTQRQDAALAQLGINASPADKAVFFHQCQRTGLDPFARQIYMVSRQGKQTIQTGIDGFRLIARRATDARRGTLGYDETLWCGQDGNWVDVWLSAEHPAAAKVTVIRDGQRYPAVAMWDEYKGTKSNGQLNQMWSTKGALMLAKCAEALALRKAFPQDLSGLYTSEEMAHADNRLPAQQAAATSETQPQAPSSAAEAVRAATARHATEQDAPKTDAEFEAFVDAIAAAPDIDALRSMWGQAKAFGGERAGVLQDLISAEVKTHQGRTSPADGAVVDAEIVEGDAA